MPKKQALEIHGDLLLDTPGGGRIHVVSDDHLLEVNCSDDRALRDAVRSFRSVYPGIRRTLGLLRTSNPLKTTIVLNGSTGKLINWAPGQRPRLLSPWQLFRALF